MEDSPEQKTCCACKQQLPLTAFGVKDRRTGRLQSRCRECLNAYLLARYHANPEPCKKRSVSWSKRNWGKVLNYARASRARNGDKIRERQREYDAKRRDQRKAYRAERADHIKARNAGYRQRNAEKLKAYNAAYYQQNQVAVNERIKKCQAANPHLYNQLHKAAKHRRKVRLANNGPCERFTDLEIYERDYWHCQLCGSPVDRSLIYPNPMSASLDHVTPIARGGGHTRANAQLAHLGCNSRKRDRAA